jgi:hypothetical protein
VTNILYDTKFNISSLIYTDPDSREFDQYKKLTMLDIADMLDSIEDRIRILRFSNMRIQLKNDSLILNATIPRGKHIPTNMMLSIDDSSVHPLESEYGTYGLRLSKVVYRDIHSKSSDLVTYLVIDYVEFDILHSRPKKKLKLTAKELFKYIAPIAWVNGTSVSKEFYRNSSLDKFEMMDCLPVFKLPSNATSRDIWFAETEEYTKPLEKWKNKMLVAGQQVKCNRTTLLKYEGNIDKLTIPNILYVERKAFENSSVKEIVVSDPATILYPEFHSLFVAPYSNKYGQEINITKAYDESLEKDFLYDDIKDGLQYELIREMFCGLVRNTSRLINNIEVSIN